MSQTVPAKEREDSYYKNKDLPDIVVSPDNELEESETILFH